MRYSVTYTSGSTGFGWEEDFNSIKDFISWLEEAKRESSYKICVYDNTIDDFIFWKDVFNRPSIDKIFRNDRDLRTTTKKKKY